MVPSGGCLLHAPPWSHACMPAMLLQLVLIFICTLPSQAQSVPLNSSVVQKDLTLGGRDGTPITYTATRSPGSNAEPFLTVQSGATLTFDNAVIEDQEPEVEYTGAFQQWLLLPSLIKLEQRAQLVLNQVLLRTSCAHVHQLARLACLELDLQTRAALQIVRDTVMVSTWHLPGQARITNLSITCSPALDLTSLVLIPGSTPSTPADIPFAAPPSIPTQDCAVAWARDWQELLHSSSVLQTYANAVIIILVSNISIALGSPAGDVPVYRDMIVSSAPSLPWVTYMDLGVIRKNATWTIYSKATLTFQGLLFASLPLGPLNKYPWSSQSWGMWMVNMERCISQATQRQQLLVVNCTLIMPSETLDYMSHWTDQVFSPFPDKRAAARWYSVDETCDPPINKTLLRSQVELVSQWQWVTDNATGFGVLFQQTTFTDKAPQGIAVTRSPLQLTKLFDKPYTPYDEIVWVDTAEQLVQQLVNGTMSNIVLLSNVSIPASLWPPSGITLNRSEAVTIAGWPAKSTVLDLQRTARAMNLVSELHLRNLVVMNGAQDVRGADQLDASNANDVLQAAANLTFLQWTFQYDREQALLRLQNVLMVVPATEFSYLLQLVVRNVTSSGNLSMKAERGGLSETGWTSIVIPDNTRMNIGSFVEDGLVGNNVTIQSQAASFDLPYSVLKTNWSVPVSQVAPAPVLTIPVPQDTTTQENPYWKPVVAIVVPVVTLVLLAPLAAILVYRRVTKRAAKAGDESKDEPGADGLESGLGGNPSSKSTTPDGPRSQERAVMTCRQGHSETLSSGTGPSVSLTNSQVYLGLPGHPPLAPGHPWSGGSPFLPPSSSTLPSASTQTLAAMYDLVPSSSTAAMNAITKGSAGSSSRGGPGTQTLDDFVFPVRQHGQASAAHNDSMKFSSSVSSGNRTPFAPGSGLRPSGAHAQASTQTTPVQGGSALDHRALHPGANFSHIGDEFVDSFDLVPEHHEQLLINRIDLSKELQASIGAPDVASQLKTMVSHMQTELGDQEVEITRVVGQGGGGVVYQGRWRGLTVAVKTLLFTVVPSQPMSRRQHRAMTEAAICNTLQHPNIVATYSYDLHTLRSTPLNSQHGQPPAAAAGSPGSGSLSKITRDASEQQQPNTGLGTEFKLYIIQEFCDGGTLKGAIEDNKLHDLSTGTPRPVMSHILQLATDIAAGMSHVHSRSIVHGDLTPANVLLKSAPATESGYVAKVADFGLSWKLAHGQAHVSNARQGTSFYIAPEVLHVGIMSKAADVFSYGMVLHEMYHGRPVWREAAKAVTANTPFKRPGLEQLTWDPACPPDFKELLCACLASDPQARPSFFTVVEQLLLMQRQLYAAEEAAAVEAAAAAVAATGDSSLLAMNLQEASARTGQSGILGSASVNLFRASRQPTSGLLAEGDVQDLFRSMRAPMLSTNSANSPWIAPEVVAQELQWLEQEREGGAEQQGPGEQAGEAVRQQQDREQSVHSSLSLSGVDGIAALPAAELPHPTCQPEPWTGPAVL